MIEAGWALPVLPPVDISCAESLQELLDMAAAGRRPFAGGTDVLVAAAHEGREPPPLVWTGSVPELTLIERSGGAVRIGAAVPLGRIAASGDVRSGARALAEAAGLVGSVQIRNVATLAGNLCNASPAADTVPPLVVHAATVEIRSRDAAPRSVAAEALAEGPGRTVLADGEVVTAVAVPLMDARQGSAYRRFTVRRSMDLAFVGVAALVGLHEDGLRIRTATIALGAVAPTVVVAHEAEAALADAEPTEEVLRAAGRAAAAGCSPITDMRATAGYRLRLVEVLTGDVILEAWNRARRGAR
jgi:carbon-monoxide dehydrogenase medium subunit